MKNIHLFLNNLSAQGIYQFTVEDYQKSSQISHLAAIKAIRRARERGEVATPYRGFHVIVPPEYRAIGCLPAERFISDLMIHLGESFYVGLLTAASYHGASHHAPQEFQVVIQKPRPEMKAGKVKISFIAHKEMALVETKDRKTPTGLIPVSTPEATAFDLVNYSHRCGGLDNVATVLSELADSLNSNKLRDIALKAGSIRLSQRLGYLLHLVGAKSKAYGLANLIRESAPRMAKLDPQLPAKGKRDKVWRIIVNTEVEPDV